MNESNLDVPVEEVEPEEQNVADDETVDSEDNAGGSSSSEKETESTEPTVTDDATGDVTTEPTTTINDYSDEQVEILFIDPYDTTILDRGTYEIELIHTFTLGDVLLATLISILIIVTLLSRLLGRSARW